MPMYLYPRISRYIIPLYNCIQLYPYVRIEL